MKKGFSSRMAKGNGGGLVSEHRDDLVTEKHFKSDKLETVEEANDLSEDFDSEEDTDGSDGPDMATGLSATGPNAVSMMEHALHSLRRRRNRRESACAGGRSDGHSRACARKSLAASSRSFHS